MKRQDNKRFSSRIVALLLAFFMVLTGALPNAAVAAATEGTTQVTTVSNSETTTVSNKYLADEIQDGAILHCWCWSFDTIRENMADIAAAGFTTVQTSPANTCNDTSPNLKIMGNDTENGTDGCWWWHYQPTDWKIGNYQLGTKEDFIAMCEEADKYGVKVIVDVIPNHTTPDLGEVSDDLYNAVGGSENLYHGNGFNDIVQWGNRYECTTGRMGGLPDVDTENPDFQVYFLNYLNDLIECGADGFRYDTAKHIGVPSDPIDSKSASKGYTTNFWPVVTGKQSVSGVTLKNANTIFNYGEVLQGDNVPEAEYAKYMRMTASSFGSTLTSAVQSKDFSVSTMSDLQHATPSRVVTWVESHDTYCNDGESVGLTDTQIRLAWAVIAARKDGTPLFFNRPDGSDGWNNRWGNNVIGEKGNDQFKSTEVVAVNFFRNAMAGESETLRNPGGNTQILQIDRGSVGTCIVNTGSAATLSGVPTALADGTYTEQVSGRTFTVSNGLLSGYLDGEKVAVIYNPDAGKISASTEGGNTEFSSDTVDITLTVKNLSDATYVTSEGMSGSFSNGDVITIGGITETGKSVTVTLKGQSVAGDSVTREFKFDKIEKNIAYIKLPSGWDVPYCYAYNTAGATNNTWPGVLMEKVSDGLYKYEVPDVIQDPLIIFYGGDDTRRYPGDMEAGLGLTGSMIYEDGVWKVYNPDSETISNWMNKVDGSYDVYFYKPSGWGSPLYCYAYESETSNNAQWPGVSMVNLGDGVYAYNLPEGWADAKIIFTDGTNQYPASMQPGLDWTDGTSMLYANGDWIEVVKEPEEEEEPVETFRELLFGSKIISLVTSDTTDSVGTFSIGNAGIAEERSLPEGVDKGEYEAANTLADILTAGPSNELYLPVEQGIGFMVSSFEEGNWPLQIGAKLISGEKGAFTVYIKPYDLKMNQFKMVETYEVSTAINTYFSLEAEKLQQVIAENEWSDDAYNIIILNTSDISNYYNMISLTGIKRSESLTLSRIITFTKSGYNLEGRKKIATSEEMILDARFNISNVTRGKNVSMTVVSKEQVEDLKLVDPTGAEVTAFSKKTNTTDGDGNKVWTLTFKVIKQKGEASYKVYGIVDEEVVEIPYTLNIAVR